MDASARKLTLVHDTEYMVEKTYHIALYLGRFKDPYFDVLHLK